jgi:uroporphyrinogen decarboxylase
MELPSLKRDFGRDITFWGGGIDTKEILPLGKPEKVRDEIKRVLDILAPGGGFVFATIHNIQADVPPANLEAMLETLSTYGRYR